MKHLLLIGLLLLAACDLHSQTDAPAERLAFCKEKGWQDQFYNFGLMSICPDEDYFICYNTSIVFDDGGKQSVDWQEDPNRWRCYKGSWEK